MKRQSGFYWVKATAKWFVAWYSDTSNEFYHGWEKVVPLEINETRILTPDEKSSIQAVIKVDGKIISYLYDEEIGTAVSNCVRYNLDKEKKITNKSNIQTELHSPPLKDYGNYNNNQS